jgi:hypothetical protein
MTRSWLVKVESVSRGELFKMHSPGKWVWLEDRAPVPRGAETIRENVHLNGYMHARRIRPIVSSEARPASMAVAALLMAWRRVNIICVLVEDKRAANQQPARRAVEPIANSGRGPVVLGRP